MQLSEILSDLSQGAIWSNDRAVLSSGLAPWLDRGFAVGFANAAHRALISRCHRRWNSDF